MLVGATTVLALIVGLVIGLPGDEPVHVRDQTSRVVSQRGTEESIPPWQSTRENTPRPPAGFIPAWQIKPGPPEPVAMPSQPVPPPDPMTHRPSMTKP
jgi:hypothetical protein